MDALHTLLSQSWAVYLSFFHESALSFALKFAPFVLFLEMPWYFITWAGVFHYLWRRRHEVPVELPYYPSVSCISNSYAEGRDVQYSINSLLEQIYPGHIQILVVLDKSARAAS